MTALAAWIRFLRERVIEIGDPRAEELVALWREAGRSGIVAALVGPGGLFAAHWVASEAQMQTLTDQL
jgi:fructuronate reductase